jgi:hypothetical protein
MQANPVAATYFGSYSCDNDNSLDGVCLANNYSHTVYYDASVTQSIRTDTTWIVDNEFDNKTDLTAYITTSFAAADVRIFYAAYGQTGYWGAAYCPTYATASGSDPNRWCKPQIVRFNSTYPAAFDTSWERRYMACHELGHTVGLDDSAIQSCMFDNSAISYNLDSSEILSINQKYLPY